MARAIQCPVDFPGVGVLAVAAAAGASVLFAPPVDDMYPGGSPGVTVHVAGVDTMEGAARPGHFDGVATVVAKLFNLAGPCRAYFGEKDWQQLGVVRRLVADLSFPVEVVGCPTVREPDGLACSSRNVRLSPADREQLPDVADTADALYENLRTTMPKDNPGVLKPQEYADVIAYLFKINQLPPGDAELKGTKAALKQVTIEAPEK